jgi:anti-sigma28 factor (negative regulator of flagellin synthesis)
VKITNNSLPTEPAVGTSGTTGSDVRAPSSDNQSSAQDSVEVSDVARLAAQLESGSASRIEELRRNFRSGNYTVEAGKLGVKLVDSMLSD